MPDREELTDYELHQRAKWALQMSRNKKEIRADEEAERERALKNRPSWMPPPNLSFEEWNQDTISPAFDKILMISHYDKHNHSNADHQLKSPKEAAPKALQTPKAEKEANGFWFAKNDRIGDFEAAAGISLNLNRDFDPRSAIIKQMNGADNDKRHMTPPERFHVTVGPVMQWRENRGGRSANEPGGK